MRPDDLLMVLFVFFSFFFFNTFTVRARIKVATSSALVYDKLSVLTFLA